MSGNCRTGRKKAKPLRSRIVGHLLRETYHSENVIMQVNGVGAAQISGIAMLFIAII
jgi:hypothetical protein